MPRYPQRRQRIAEECVGTAHQRSEQLAVYVSIRAESLASRLQIAFQNRRCTVVERMNQRYRRMNPFQAVFRQRQRPKKRRADPKRMNGRANIVDETWQCELARPRPAAQ